MSHKHGVSLRQNLSPMRNGIFIGKTTLNSDPHWENTKILGILARFSSCKQQNLKSQVNNTSGHSVACHKKATESNKFDLLSNHSKF